MDPVEGNGSFWREIGKRELCHWQKPAICSEEVQRIRQHAAIRVPHSWGEGRSES